MHQLDAEANFAAIARDPGQLRTFLAGIGSSAAPSRLRAAELLDGCAAVLDVGCGPAVTFETLRDRRGSTSPLMYVGVDPVAALIECGVSRLEAAGVELRYRSGAEPWCLVQWCTGDYNRELPTLLHGEPLGIVQRCPVRAFGGVLVRHVLEHLNDPWPLLAASAAAAASRVVVVLSQPTRVAGVAEPLLTDHFLGALRWSHWRAHLLATMDVAGFRLDVHESGPPLVMREELFAWSRVRP